MFAGLGVLRLAPREFWAATPREIAAAFTCGDAADALDRAGLDRLMQCFPDMS